MLSILKTYRLKARWRGTAITIHIAAKDEDEAMKKAAKKVLKMEGGVRCMDIELLGELDAKK